METLTPQEVAIIGLVATIVVYLLNLLAKRVGVVLGRAVLTILLYVVAFALAGLFRPSMVMGAFVPASPFPVFVGPADGDPAVFVGIALPYAILVIGWLASYATALVVAFGAIAGVATLIYNTLGKQVLDGVVSQGSEAIRALIDNLTAPTPPSPPTDIQ